MANVGPRRPHRLAWQVFFVNSESHESSEVHLGPILDVFPREDISYSESNPPQICSRAPNPASIKLVHNFAQNSPDL